MLTSSHMNSVSITGATGFIDYKSTKHSLLVIIQMCINWHKFYTESKTESSLLDSWIQDMSLLY